MEVVDGWERAVETVLGDYLQAICVTDVASAATSLAQLNDGSVTLLVEATAPSAGDEGTSTLASKVTRAPAAVLEILRSVRVAETLDRALQVRDQIGEAGSVITPDGVWLSQSWFRVARDKDARAGVIGREHDMRRLKGEIRELRARADSARKLLQDGRNRQSQLEDRRETMQRDAAALLNEYSETKAGLDAVRFQIDQANARQAALAEERSDIEKERYTAEQQARGSKMLLSQALESLEDLAAQKEALASRPTRTGRPRRRWRSSSRAGAPAKNRPP